MHRDCAHGDTFGCLYDYASKNPMAASRRPPIVIAAGVRMPVVPKTSSMLGMPGTAPSTNQTKKNAAMKQPASPTPRRKRLKPPDSRPTLSLRNSVTMR